MDKRRRHIALVLIGGALATAGCEQLLDIPDVTLGSSSGGGDGGNDVIGSDGDGSVIGVDDGGPVHQLPSTSPLGCTPDDWCWVTPLPQGNDLAGSWTGSDTEMWAVGQSGTIIFFDGEKIQTGFITTLDLNAVWGDGSGAVWAMGTGGVLFTHAAGAPIDKWTPVPAGIALPATTIITGLWGDGKGNLWAVGHAGAFFEFSFAKSAWSSAVLDAGNLSATSFTAIGQDSHGNGIAVGTNGAAFSFDGTSWSPLSLPGVLPTTTLRSIVHDGGSTWIFGNGPGFNELAIGQDSSGTWSDDTALLFVDSGVGGADNDFGNASFLGPDGTLTVFGYYAWTRTPAGVWSFQNFNEQGVFGSAATDVHAFAGITHPVAFGERGLVAKLEDDAGTTFVSKDLDRNGSSIGEIFPAGDAVWISSYPQIFRVDDGGMSLVTTLDGGSPKSGYGAAENDVWLSVAPDAGYHWNGTKMTVGHDPPAFAAMNGTSTSDVYAFEPTGKTRFYNGATWSDGTPWSTIAVPAVETSFIEPVTHDIWVDGDDPFCDGSCNIVIGHSSGASIAAPFVTSGYDAPQGIGGLTANDIWMPGIVPYHWNGTTIANASVPTGSLLLGVGMSATQIWFAGHAGPGTTQNGMWTVDSTATFQKLPGIGASLDTMATTPTQVVTCSTGGDSSGACLWHRH